MKNLLLIVALFASINAYAQGQLQKESAGNLGYVSGHIMQLADAIPADKYAWTPKEGVRDVAGVCAHIISANYFFASKLGATIPADVKMETIEKDIKTKEIATAELKRSSDLLIAAIQNASDATLAAKVEFPFPGEYTGMSALLISLGHCNEHLGQLIAYARTNGIAPPWSN